MRNAIGILAIFMIASCFCFTGAAAEDTDEKQIKARIKAITDGQAGMMKQGSRQTGRTGPMRGSNVQLLLLQYYRTNDDKYLSRAKELLEGVTSGKSGKSGGRESRRSTVSSAQTMKMCLDMYNATGDKHYLKKARERYPFLVNAIDKDGSAMRSIAISADALFEFAGVAGEPEAAKKANAAIERLIKEYRDAKTGLFQVGEGKPSVPISQAFALRAFLSAFQYEQDKKYLDEAKKLADAALKRFWNEKEGCFKTSGKSPGDPASGADLFAGANLASSLLDLSLLSGDGKYKIHAKRVIEATMKRDIQGRAASCWARAADKLVNHSLKAVIIGAKNHKRTRALMDAVYRVFDPTRVLLTLDPKTDAARLEKEQLPDFGEPALFACVEDRCSLPVTDPKEVKKTLKAFLASPS